MKLTWTTYPVMSQGILHVIIPPGGGGGVIIPPGGYSLQKEDCTHYIFGRVPCFGGICTRCVHTIIILIFGE